MSHATGGGFDLQSYEGETPILDALESHAKAERISLHVPGHHQGRLLPARFDAWFGQASKLDATELVGLDNLHRATSAIKYSRQLTAAHYGAVDTFYSVNGATACVMAAVAACVEETDKRTIVVAGPCHMSLWRALVHADALPLFVSGNWSSDLHLVKPPTAKQLADVLENAKGVAAVFATSPSYQGVVAPVQQYSELARASAVPLIIDEAHGAHFGLHPDLPKHSVAHGADIVVQSPHKTLPCITQAAWVHVQGSQVRASALERHLLFLQTTSPSYVLLSALDAAQAWLRTSGTEAAAELLNKLYPYVGHRDKEDVDPFRLWIPMASGEASQRFESQLREHGIFLEYADNVGALAIFGMGQTKRDVSRFFDVASAWIDVSHRMADVRGLISQAQWQHHASAFVMSPREVFHARKEFVALNEARGRISGTAVSPYPPGVPYIWPGEEVTKDHVDKLLMWQATNKTVVGLSLDDRMEVVVSRGAKGSVHHV